MPLVVGRCFGAKCISPQKSLTSHYQTPHKSIQVDNPHTSTFKLPELHKLNNILVFCILGSVFRLVYGILYKPWLLSPDQLAAEIALDECMQSGQLPYDHLIHYPHEGGSILISLIALCVKLFWSNKALTVTAFVLDMAIRYFQLHVVRRIFKVEVSLAFGIWTVFGLPSLVPWASVTFGLHALAAFFPFALLYLLWLDRQGKRHFVAQGIFLGLALWFSYDNAILVPVYFLYLILTGKSLQQGLFALGSLAIVMLLHAYVRAQFDPGFHLAGFSAGTIRGTTFEWMQQETYSQVLSVWVVQFPDSTMMRPSKVFLQEAFRQMWPVLAFSGLIGAVGAGLRRLMPTALTMGVWIIALFVAAYAISPFIYDGRYTASFIAYRHFSYILPLVALYVIHGLQLLPLRRWTTALFLISGIYWSFLLFTGKPASKIPVRETGWVLATKFGHDGNGLCKLVDAASLDKKELMVGIGWGLAATLFQGEGGSDGERAMPKVRKLVDTMNAFPRSSRPFLLGGVTWAFKPFHEPSLDACIHPMILQELKASDARAKGIR